MPLLQSIHLKSTLKLNQSIKSIENNKNKINKQDRDYDKNENMNVNKQINYSRYKTELCRQFSENGECKYGDKCQFAHGYNDLKDVNRHPKYKTDFCKTFHSKGFCPYGPRCHFIHDTSEKFENNGLKNFSTSNLELSTPSKKLGLQSNSNKHNNHSKFINFNSSTADLSLNNYNLVESMKSLNLDNEFGQLLPALATTPTKANGSLSPISNNFTKANNESLLISSFNSADIFNTPSLFLIGNEAPSTKGIDINNNNKIKTNRLHDINETNDLLNNLSHSSSSSSSSQSPSPTSDHSSRLSNSSIDSKDLNDSFSFNYKLFDNNNNDRKLNSNNQSPNLIANFSPSDLNKLVNIDSFIMNQISKTIKDNLSMLESTSSATTKPISRPSMNSADSASLNNLSSTGVNGSSPSLFKYSKNNSQATNQKIELKQR